MKEQRMLSKAEVKKMFGIKSDHTLNKMIEDGYLPPKVGYKKNCLFSLQAIYEIMNIESNEVEEFITVDQLAELTGYNRSTIIKNINAYPHYAVKKGHRIKYFFRKKELEGKIANVKYGIPLFYLINDRAMEQLGYLLILMRNDMNIPDPYISIIKCILIEGIYEVPRIAGRIRKEEMYTRRLLDKVMIKLPSYIIRITEQIENYHNLQREYAKLEEAIKANSIEVNEYYGKLAMKIDETQMSSSLKMFFRSHEFETYGDIMKIINKNRGSINTFLDMYSGFGPKKNRELKYFIKKERLYEYIL